MSPESAPQDCTCLAGKFYFDDFEDRKLGMDRNLGEAELMTCKKCRRLWLRYYWENAAFTKSGRWYHGLVREGDGNKLTAENAPAYLAGLEWYLRGGSFYNGEVSRASGPLILT
jgi:hypothetical protein